MLKIFWNVSCLCVCFGGMSMWVQVPMETRSVGSPRSWSLTCAGNWTLVPWKKSKCSQLWAISLAPKVGNVKCVSQYRKLMEVNCTFSLKCVWVFLLEIGLPSWYYWESVRHRTGCLDWEQLVAFFFFSSH